MVNELKAEIRQRGVGNVLMSVSQIFSSFNEVRKNDKRHPIQKSRVEKTTNTGKVKKSMFQLPLTDLANFGRAFGT